MSEIQKYVILRRKAFVTELVDVPVLGTGVFNVSVRVRPKAIKCFEGKVQLECIVENKLKPYVFHFPGSNFLCQKLKKFLFFQFLALNVCFFSFILLKYKKIRKAFSSAGRAAALQAAGHRFESGRA